MLFAQYNVLDRQLTKNDADTEAAMTSYAQAAWSEGLPSDYESIDVEISKDNFSFGALDAKPLSEVYPYPLVISEKVNISGKTIDVRIENNQFRFRTSGMDYFVECYSDGTLSTYYKSKSSTDNWILFFFFVDVICLIGIISDICTCKSKIKDYHKEKVEYKKQLKAKAEE